MDEKQILSMHEYIRRQLKRIPLFKDLGREELAHVASVVERRRYRSGTLICRQGEVGREAYIVERGRLRVLHVDAQGNEEEVDRLGPGDYFGETSLLVGEPRDATVEVIEDAVLLKLTKPDFDELLEEHKRIARDLRMREDVAHKRRAKRFPWQAPDEVVVLRRRKHISILIRNLFVPGAVLLLIGLGTGYLYSLIARLIILLIGGAMGILPLGLTIYLILDQLNDDYLVTNKRIVQEEKVPLIRQSRSEASLLNIQNIQLTREGPWSRIFDYGTLTVETAGRSGQVTFRHVPHPGEVQDIVFKQRDRVLARARAESRSAIRDTLQQRFGNGEGGSGGEDGATQPDDPEEPRQSKRGGPLKAIGWVFRYFLPPLHQEEGETITWRKHWVVLIGPIALPSLLILGSTALAVFIIWLLGTRMTALLAGYGLILSVLLVWWLWQYENWRNDIYQITATRIIDIERLPFYLRETRREASLDRIQNAHLEVSGVLARIFNSGTVTIETAGAGAFTFEDVKDPGSVQAEIYRRKDAFEREERERQAQRLRDDLVDWFTIYDQIRDTKPDHEEDRRSTQREF